jgi:transcriptional regulator with XRE-family HTH domain
MFSSDIRRTKLRSLLKDARLSAKLRQTDVANILNKPQSYVAKVESGERKLDLIEAIDYCTAIKLDLIRLFASLK